MSQNLIHLYLSQMTLRWHRDRAAASSWSARARGR